MFFVPISIEGKSSIPLDHIVSWILKIPYYRETYGLILCFLGVILPFWKGTWNKSRVKMIFSIINIAALPFILMAVFHIGPEALLEKDMIPFIYSKIVVPVTTIVPVGSVFLAFIISYGLMEFVGVFMRPIMKPILKLPDVLQLMRLLPLWGRILLLFDYKRCLSGRKIYFEGSLYYCNGIFHRFSNFMIIVAKLLVLWRIIG